VSEEKTIRVPSPSTPWNSEVIEFALSYNGYDRHGTQGAYAIAGAVHASWEQNGTPEGDLASLRCALFFVQRAAHHTDQPPDSGYLAALLAAIQERSGGWVDGPADPYP
jgi:hypothetical protein